MFPDCPALARAAPKLSLTPIYSCSTTVVDYSTQVRPLPTVGNSAARAGDAREVPQARRRRNRMGKRSLFSTFLLLLITPGAIAQLVFPPSLPEGRHAVTDRTEAFLQPTGRAAFSPRASREATPGVRRKDCETHCSSKNRGKSIPVERSQSLATFRRTSSHPEKQFSRTENPFASQSRKAGVVLDRTCHLHRQS